MIGNYKIITLCGSTKFKEEFIAQQKRLTLGGNIVISVGLFGHSGDEEVWAEHTKPIENNPADSMRSLITLRFIRDDSAYLDDREIEITLKTVYT